MMIIIAKTKLLFDSRLTILIIENFIVHILQSTVWKSCELLWGFFFIEIVDKYDRVGKGIYPVLQEYCEKRAVKDESFDVKLIQWSVHRSLLKAIFMVAAFHKFQYIAK